MVRGEQRQRALALNTLTHLPQVGCPPIIVAAQIVVAFFGHNLIHVFEARSC